LLCLLLLAGGGYAYWRLIYYPQTPQFALDRFFEAARARDYDTIYSLVQVPASLKILVPNANGLRRLAERVPGLIPEVEAYRLGRAKVEGDSAQVEAATTLRGGANAESSVSTFQVELVRREGQWRIDGQWVMREMARKGAGDLLKSLVF
jgi:hypothetical protein